MPEGADAVVQVEDTELVESSEDVSLGCLKQIFCHTHALTHMHAHTHTHTHTGTYNYRHGLLCLLYKGRVETKVRICRVPTTGQDIR